MHEIFFPLIIFIKITFVVDSDNGDCCLANCSKRSNRRIIFENNVIVDLDRLHLFRSITITITITEPRNRIQLQLRLHKNGVIDYKLRITIIIEPISARQVEGGRTTQLPTNHNDNWTANRKYNSITRLNTKSTSVNKRLASPAVYLRSRMRPIFYISGVTRSLPHNAELNGHMVPRFISFDPLH